MTKFNVCVTKGHKRLFLWPTFVALSNGMYEIRDGIFVDLLVLWRTFAAKITFFYLLSYYAIFILHSATCMAYFAT